MTRLLDCTLRDGGYYTNWTFSDSFVERYCSILDALGITDVEIGYSNPYADVYRGEYYYCHPKTIECVLNKLEKRVQIWLMVDLKHCEKLDEVIRRLSRHVGKVYGVRITVPFESQHFLDDTVRGIKKLGFKISLNLMYSHKYLDNPEKLLNFLPFKASIDALSIVDSYGVLKPNDVAALVSNVCELFPEVEIGFHGHNNMELAAANALEAEKNGVHYIDSTMAGFGRGAGNLRTELAVLLFSQGVSNITTATHNALCEIDELFEQFSTMFQWGAKTPFAIAAQRGMPQSLIMSLISLKRLNYINVVDNSINYQNETIPEYPVAQVKEKDNDESENFENSILVLAPSSRYRLKSYEFDLISEAFNISRVFVLGGNSLSCYLEQIMDSDINVTLIIEGNKLQKHHENINKLGDPEVVILPPHIIETHPYRRFTCRHSLSNPLEAVLDSLSKSMPSKIFVFGLDGDDEDLRLETQSLFERAKLDGHGIVSLIECKYSILKSSAFSCI
ncbi:hypothetical protein OAN95_00010 [Alphaproteobacteria bacterium]|nr:hypothetical protein [Alphaproteobacteria bacterium]